LLSTLPDEGCQRLVRYARLQVSDGKWPDLRGYLESTSGQEAEAERKLSCLSNFEFA